VVETEEARRYNTPSMSNNTPYGVIFDMDGVLIDSTEAHYEAWKRLGENIGVPYARPFFNRTYGMHNNQSIPMWLGRPVVSDELFRLGYEKEAIYRTIAKSKMKPMTGVVDCLRRLVLDGAHLAVGSSGPRENLDLALNRLGVVSLFRAIVSGDQVVEGKPDPAIFLKAAGDLHLSPAQCLVVEDAPPGIEAGHRAGMKVVAIPTSRQPKELSKADRLIPSLSELTPDIARSMIAPQRESEGV
jgi:HAD superfamily hydrolase (TIGR01509 family)